MRIALFFIILFFITPACNNVKKGYSKSVYKTDSLHVRKEHRNIQTTVDSITRSLKVTDYNTAIIALDAGGNIIVKNAKNETTGNYSFPAKTTLTFNKNKVTETGETLQKTTVVEQKNGSDSGHVTSEGKEIQNKKESSRFSISGALTIAIIALGVIGAIFLYLKFKNRNSKK